MSPPNHKRTTSSLGPPIFYAVKNRPLKDRRFPLTWNKRDSQTYTMIPNPTVALTCNIGRHVLTIIFFVRKEKKSFFVLFWTIFTNLVIIENGNNFGMFNFDYNIWTNFGREQTLAKKGANFVNGTLFGLNLWTNFGRGKFWHI